MSGNSQRVFFNGAHGKIEGLIGNASTNSASNSIVLLLHSDPHMGGSFDDLVIQGASQVFIDNGFTTLAINARGVGRSEGKFESGLEELLDASLALDWLEERNVSVKDVWVVGFSFSSWCCVQLAMRRPEVTRFVIISPVINRFEHSILSSHSPIKGLIMQGDLDSVTNPDDIKKIFASVMKQDEQYVQYSSVPSADHFFREKNDLLTSTLKNYVKYNQLEDAA